MKNNPELFTIDDLDKLLSVFKFQRVLVMKNNPELFTIDDPFSPENFWA